MNEIKQRKKNEKNIGLNKKGRNILEMAIRFQIDDNIFIYITTCREMGPCGCCYVALGLYSFFHRRGLIKFDELTTTGERRVEAPNNVLLMSLCMHPAFLSKRVL